MSNLPVDPYDRTVIVETHVDNPDRAPLSGTGRDIVVTLWPADQPGRTMAFLNAAGQWVPFTTTEFVSWGGIIGNIEDQADLMAMFAEYSKTTEYATVAFTGNYNDLINKPPLGTVSPLNLNGSSQQFLRGDGVWALPQDVFATWGQINGNINDQNDLMALLNAKAPINNPTFTGLVNFPTPPVDDNSTRGATTAWFFGQAFNGVPVMDGVASSGDSTRWARGNHRHPTDTTKIGDAPNDGQQYARQSQTWTVVSGGGGLTWPLLAPNGTAAAPSYSFSSATNAGIWFAGANQLGISTAGVTRLSISATLLTSTVPIVLPADPTAGLQASTKQYVDAKFPVSVANGGTGSTVEKYLPLVGGTLNAGVGTTLLTVKSTTGNADITFDAPASGATGSAVIRSFRNGKNRWAIVPGDGIIESGSNTGSNFLIRRYDDTGTIPNEVVNINRATGATTLSGDLIVVKSTDALITAKSTAGHATVGLDSMPGHINALWGARSGVSRWEMYLGDDGAESGANAGSNFQISRHSDAGAALGNALTINRATGNVTLSGPGLGMKSTTGFCGIGIESPVGQGNYIQGAKNGIGRWSMYFGNGDAETGSNAGSNFQLISLTDAGAYLGTPLDINRATGLTSLSGLTVYGALTVYTPTYPTLHLADGSSNGKRIRVASNNNLEIINAANSNVILDISDIGVLRAYTGYNTKAGTGGVYGSSIFNFNWTGSMAVWVDSTNIGNMSVTSDERVKQAIEPLVLDTEAFAAIQPIKYRWADVGIFMDDGKDHWGFSTQNLMSLMPPTVVGDIEAKQENDDPQPASLDTLAILAQTVLQVQALMRDVETLKGAPL